MPSARKVHAFLLCNMFISTHPRECYTFRWMRGFLIARNMKCVMIVWLYTLKWVRGECQLHGCSQTRTTKDLFLLFFFADCSWLNICSGTARVNSVSTVCHCFLSPMDQTDDGECTKSFIDKEINQCWGHGH